MKKITYIGYENIAWRKYGSENKISKYRVMAKIAKAKIMA